MKSNAWGNSPFPVVSDTALNCVVATDYAGDGQTSKTRSRCLPNAPAFFGFHDSTHSGLEIWLRSQVIEVRSTLLGQLKKGPSRDQAARCLRIDSDFGLRCAWGCEG